MTERLLNSQGQPVTIICATSAYVRVTPSIAGITDAGQYVGIPVSFDDATMTAALYGRDGVVERPDVVRGADGTSVVAIEPRHTADAGVGATTELTLELKAILTRPIANTSYTTGDTLGFRWSLYATPPLK